MTEKYIVYCDGKPIGPLVDVSEIEVRENGNYCPSISLNREITVNLSVSRKRAQRFCFLMRYRGDVSNNARRYKGKQPVRFEVFRRMNRILARGKGKNGKIHEL